MPLPNVHPVGHFFSQKWRADIDGLRAVAVLSVVIFHAFPARLSGGYIGVDIFFVISGFLISSIIYGNLHKGTFRFFDFYGRRIRRIFPALILVLMASLVVGWLVLLSDEYKELGKEAAGGAAFIANFVLWASSGYFDADADLKPLLHLWSLGIEEQFYMLWPLLLWFAWRTGINLLFAAIVLAVISFVAGVVLIEKDSVATFYSPLTRFWELLAGSILAYFNMKKAVSPSAVLLGHVKATLGVVLLLTGMLLLNNNSAFPGYWALFPVVGAALLISAGEKAWFNRYVLSNRLMVWIGLISYPLYLWHWPLLVFPRIIQGESPGWSVRLIAIALSIVLAWLTYKLLETPIRHSQRRRSLTIVLIILMALVGFAGVVVYKTNGADGRALAIAASDFSAAKVDYNEIEAGFDGGNIDLSNVTFLGRSTERVLFLGDSLMGLYLPRVQKLYENTSDLPLYSNVFAARAGCRPVLNARSINSQNRSCDEYYNTIIELALQPEYKRIVLSASWQRIFSEDVFSTVGEGFAADLSLLKAAGKEIVFLSMLPVTQEQMPGHIVRPLRYLHILNRDTVKEPLPDMYLDRSEIDFRRLPQWAKFKSLADQIGAVIVDPLDAFCEGDRCPSLLNGRPLYRDMFHVRDSVARDKAFFIDMLVNSPVLMPNADTSLEKRL